MSREERLRRPVDSGSRRYQSPTGRKGRDLGIEVELEGRETVVWPTVPGWRMKADGSLVGNGVEYVIKTPTNPRWVQRCLSRLWEALKPIEAELTNSGRCGVHVHLNVSFLTNKQMFAVVGALLIAEDLIFEIGGRERRHNVFCLPTAASPDTLSRMGRFFEAGRFEPISRSGRYYAINTAALYKYGTIEIRSLRSPICHEKVCLVGKMLVSARNFIVTNDWGLEDVIDLYARKGAGKFIKTLFGDVPKFYTEKVDMDINFGEVYMAVSHLLSGLVQGPEFKEAFECYFERRSTEEESEEGDSERITSTSFTVDGPLTHRGETLRIHPPLGNQPPPPASNTARTELWEEAQPQLDRFNRNWEQITGLIGRTGHVEGEVEDTRLETGLDGETVVDYINDSRGAYEEI